MSEGETMDTELETMLNAITVETTEALARALGQKLGLSEDAARTWALLRLAEALDVMPPISVYSPEAQRAYAAARQAAIDAAK